MNSERKLRTSSNQNSRAVHTVWQVESLNCVTSDPFGNHRFFGREKMKMLCPCQALSMRAHIIRKPYFVISTIFFSVFFIPFHFSFYRRMKYDAWYEVWGLEVETYRLFGSQEVAIKRMLTFIAYRAFIRLIDHYHRHCHCHHKRLYSTVYQKLLHTLTWYSSNTIYTIQIP